MVNVFREEPLFIKIRKPAKNFPQWIHLKLPQGRYKVNAPLQHRLICKEAQLIAEQDFGSLYGSDQDLADPYKSTPASLGAPHHALYLEATTAQSLSTSHDHIYGKTENEELLKGSTKFAKLTHDSFEEIVPRFARKANGEMDLIKAPVVYKCNRFDNAYAFNLGTNDETSLHLRIADCEGHGLFLLSEPLKPDDGVEQGNLFGEETIIEVHISLVYQVFVQDIEMPQHPKEGFLGYYRNAITEPISNI